MANSPCEAAGRGKVARCTRERRWKAWFLCLKHFQINGFFLCSPLLFRKIRSLQIAHVFVFVAAISFVCSHNFIIFLLISHSKRNRVNFWTTCSLGWRVIDRMIYTTLYSRLLLVNAPVGKGYRVLVDNECAVWSVWLRLRARQIMTASPLPRANKPETSTSGSGSGRSYTYPT